MRSWRNSGWASVGFTMKQFDASGILWETTTTGWERWGLTGTPILPPMGGIFLCLLLGVRFVCLKIWISQDKVWNYAAKTSTVRLIRPEKSECLKTNYGIMKLTLRLAYTHPFSGCVWVYYWTHFKSNRSIYLERKKNGNMKHDGK